MKIALHSLFVYFVCSVVSIAMAHSGHHAPSEHLHLIETAVVILLAVLGLVIYMKSSSK